MKSAAKIYTRDFTIGLFVYGLLLGAMNMYLNGNEVLPKWLMFGLALTPMAGVFLCLRAMLAFSRTWDEFVRKNVMEAVVISFTITAMGTFAYGFLEGIGFPKLDTHFVFTLLVGGMGLAQLYTCWWRYR